MSRKLWNDEDCKGCVVYSNDRDFIFCHGICEINDIECPCALCLIKTMCRDLCSLAHEYEDRILEEIE